MYTDIWWQTTILYCDGPLYPRDFLWYPEGTPFVPRPRYTYIIILYNYNIIYIIFPRLLLFPSSILCLGKFLWPSLYFSTKDSCSVCTSVSVSVSVLFEEKPILLLGKNLLLFYFWKNPFVGKKPFYLHRGWSLSGTFYSFILEKPISVWEKTFL